MRVGMNYARRVCVFIFLALALFRIPAFAEVCKEESCFLNSKGMDMHRCWRTGPADWYAPVHTHVFGGYVYGSQYGDIEKMYTINGASASMTEPGDMGEFCRKMTGSAKNALLTYYEYDGGWEGKTDCWGARYDILDQLFFCVVDTLIKENCTDGKDNDGDGFTDCDDIKCKGKAECKPKFNTQCVGCCGGDDAPSKGPKPLSPNLQKLLGKDFQPECCKDDQASGDKDQTKTPPPPTPCEKQDGEPIGVNSGYFTDSRVDIALPGRMVAAVVPYYHSQSDFMGPLGHGWSSVLSVRLLKLTDSTFTLRDMWGQREDFDREGINKSQRFYSANLILEGDAASIRLDRDHVFVFNQNDGTLRSIKDNRGGSVNLVYETSSGIYGSQAVTGTERRKYGIHGVSRYAIPQGHRATITQDFRVNRIEDGDDATRFLQVNWDTSGMVGSIQDPVGRKVSYQYDRTGNLTQVTFPDGTARRYRWTDTNDIHRMTAFDAKAIRPSLLTDTSILTRNEWDVIGRVTRQEHQGAEWKVARSNYTRNENKVGNNNRITWTRLSTVTRTEPDGLGGTRTTKREFKDEVTNNQPLDADGKPAGNATWYSRQETIKETVGNIDRTSVIVYDQNNAVVQEIRPDGTTVSTSRNGLVESVTEKPPTGFGTERTTTVTLDASGHAIRQVVSDANGSEVKTWTWSNGLLVNECTGEGDQAECLQKTYDASNRLQTETEASGAVTTYWYSGSKMQPDTVTFADGSGERYTRDALGRVIEIKNSLGQVRTTAYDALGRDTLSCGIDGVCVRNVYDGPDLVRTEEGGQILSGKFVNPLRTRRFEVDGWGHRIKEWLVTPTREVLKRKSKVDAFGNVVEVWDNPDSTNTDSTKWRLVERNQYDGRNFLLKHLTYPAGPTGAVLSSSYSYDALGHATKETDARGGVTKRRFDPWGNVLLDTNAVGSVVRKGYDALNRVFADSVQVGAGTSATFRVTKHVFDAQGRETLRVGPRQDTSLWIYEKGRLLKERSPEGRWTTYAYDAMGRVTTIVRKNVDTALVADADDQVTEYGYDKLGRRVKETVSGTVQHRYGLDAAGRVVLDTNALGLVTKMVYDDLGRLVKTTTPSGDNLYTDYDAQGRVSVRLLNTDTLSVTRYDDADRPVIERTPGKGSVVRKYDGTDFVTETTDSVGIVTTTVQDKSGRDSTVSMAGKTRSTKRDELGRTVAQTDERGNTIKMGYDALDRLVSLKDNEGNETKFSYIDSSNGWQRRNTAYPDAKVEDHVWDREGQLRQFVDGRGIAAVYRYDSLGRLATIRYLKADGSEAADSVALGYDAEGRLAKAAQGGESVVTSYDLLGRPLSNTQTITGNAYVLGYAYDDAARTRLVTLPDGTTTTTAWTALGQVGAVRAGTRTLASFAYANGLEATRSFGNGIMATSTWDAAGRPASVAYGLNGVPLAGLSFGYDAQGNRNAITRPQAALSEAMSYTADNQLQSWTKGALSQSWSLDSRGNWTSWSSNGTAQSRTYTGANELSVMGSTPVTWDLAGNLTSDGSLSFAWNARGLMVSASNAGGAVGSYGYDPLGRRSVKTVAGVTTVSVYDGWQCVWQKVTGSGVDTVKSFVYGNYIDEPLAMIRKWGTSTDTVWYLQGNNFNVEALTDRTGAIVERYEYTPYGKATVYTGKGVDGAWFTMDDVAASVSARGNALTFQGRELDTETGNLYFRNRYYSPGMGRFTGKDPLSYDAGDVNLFRFVSNAPMQTSDPSGLMPLIQVAACDEFQTNASLRNKVMSYPGGSVNLAFVTNYFCGDGGTQTLSSLGAYGAYVNSAAFKGMREKVMGEISKGKCNGKKAFSGGETDTKNDLFSIGKHQMAVSWACSEGECNVSYSLSDRFNDPRNWYEDIFSKASVSPKSRILGPDGWISNLFRAGMPFSIRDSWQESFGKKCCNE